MRVLVAFDKFKHALSATEACRIAAEAWRGERPNATIDECPLTDGGEGFAAILTGLTGGERVEATVTGPRGEPRVASYGWVAWERVPVEVRGRFEPAESASPPPPPEEKTRQGGRLRSESARDEAIAVVEMAAASGLELVRPEERDPWVCTSRGTGELIRAAAARMPRSILLGIGGSATNDLGTGALEALGWRFLSADGADVAPAVPRRWDAIAQVAGAAPPGFPPLRIACDVSNPLLGPEGATAVYGFQKGLRSEDYDRLEAAMARMGRLLCRTFGRDEALMDRAGAGAAGGIGFALMAALGARLVPGSALIADWLELDRRVREADVIVTGEGGFDASSLSGKGPGAVIERAAGSGKPVHVLAGRASVDPARLPASVRVRSLSPEGLALGTALRETPSRLAASIRELARGTSSAQ